MATQQCDEGRLSTLCIMHVVPTGSNSRQSRYLSIPEDDYIKKYEKNPELWPVEFFVIVYTDVYKTSKHNNMKHRYLLEDQLMEHLNTVQAQELLLLDGYAHQKKQHLLLDINFLTLLLRLMLDIILNFQMIGKNLGRIERLIFARMRLLVQAIDLKI